MPRANANPAHHARASMALALGAVTCLAVLSPNLVTAAEAGSRLAVAAKDEATARAAIEALEQGGSAIDAAIAGSAMLGVTAPVSCGIGGGGFALVYDAAEKKTFALDYREVAPRGYGLDTYLSKSAGAPIGIPGEVAGWVELHRRWGKRSLAEDLGAAVRAAEGGFLVTGHVAGMLADNPRLFLGTPYGAVFAPQGAIARAGDRASNRPLGATLRRIGAEGAKAFYEGPVAAEVVQVSSAAGSPITLADLASYRVALREPIRGSWEGYEVVTMPPPSAGGILLLETLGLFSKSELANMGFGTAGYIHMLAEGMRGAVADRMRAVGDPGLVPDRSAELLAPERLKARRARIGSERTHAAPRFPLVESGTSQLVVADAKGNVVAVTTTVNGSFGSGVLAPESGVLMNDELTDFTGPDTAALFGEHPGPNPPRAGARPVSSMMPTFVLRDGAPVVAIGGSGGTKIPVNVTQVLLCQLVFAKSPEACVAAPRFFTPQTGPTLSYLAKDLPPLPVQIDLMERGEQLKTFTSDTTAVQMIAIDRTGGTVRMIAAADPRKGGASIVR